jgi:hypothetical protein
MSGDFWFRPKTQGYGAYPANWKGWAAVIVFALVQLALVVGLLAPGTEWGQAPGLTAVGAFMLGTACITAVFISLTRAKTDGEWRWRWPKG